MAVCVHDNPAIMHRECWQDGRLIYSIKWILLEDLYEGIKRPPIFFGANIGPWVPGQLVGDREAMGNATV